MKTILKVLIFFPVFSFSQVKDSVQNIKTVEIIGKKPMVKRKVDRLEFNIDNTPLQNLNGWEILKNTPNIQVQNETLSVRNSSQIVVTINDKKSLMSADQLRQYLENMDGKNIAGIEVITSPPAKYEAQGSAVINIKLKKNTSEGYKGRLSGRWHQSEYAKERIGLLQSFNTGKWQLSANYDFVSGDYVRRNLDVTIFDKDGTRWESDMVRKTKNHNQQLYNFSSQYAKDSLTTFEFGFNGFYAPKAIGNYRIPTTIYTIETNLPQSNYSTANDRKEFSNNFNAYFVVDKKFGKNNITWSNNFSRKLYRENQDVTTHLKFIHQQPKSSHFATGNEQNVSLFSSQLDHRFSKESLTIESGLKYSHVKNKTDNRFFTGDSVSLVFDAEKSNVFNYLENIFAAYLSAEYHYKKWELKSGLRSETTSITTDSSNPVVKNNKISIGFFPSVYVLYKIDDSQQISASYNKRIDRPNYDFLNPAKSYYTLYSYFQGDAGLKSSIIHNLSLSYTLKDWNFEIYHKYTKHPSMEISIQNLETFETVYHYTNIDHGWNWGANFSKNFTIKPYWKLNLFFMGDYNGDFFIGADGLLRNNKVFFYNANISTQITLDKSKNWDLSASYGYYSKSIQGSFTISPSQRTSLIINHKMFDKKLELGLVFNDIFKTDRNTISTNYANQHQYFKDYRDTQYCMLNVKYNFGNMKVKEVKPKEKTEEQNRM